MKKGPELENGGKFRFTMGFFHYYMEKMMADYVTRLSTRHSPYE
jgi:hypothetical protein